MNVSPRGVAFIAGWELFRSHPYYDAAGYPTIGYGHLLGGSKNVPLTTWPPIDQLTALRMLQDDLEWVNQTLIHDISNTPRSVPTTQDEFNALASLLYNIGPKQYLTSTIRRMHFNHAPEMQIRTGFCLFVKAFTDDHMIVTLPGLVRRRIAEANIYLLSQYRGSDGKEIPSQTDQQPQAPGTV